jgi:hypothetical protein
MEKVYVSIDIDYWNDYSQSRQEAIGYIKNVINLCPNNVKVVIYHDKLLPHINKSKANTVYNIDHHSDLADLCNVKKRDLNEGTWGNFINKKAEGSFVWFYPFEKCYRHSGRCDAVKNPFTKECKKICGWKDTKRILHKPSISSLGKKNVVGVGICLSPDWISKQLSYPIMESLIENGCMSKNMFKETLKKYEFYEKWL